MAIAYVATSVKVQNPDAVQTVAFNAGSPTNGLMLIGIAYQATTDDFTGFTYAGVSATRLLTFTANGERMYIYGLLAPAAGSNNMVFSKTGASTYITAYAVSYSGVKQTGLPDATGSNSGSSNTASFSITTIDNNCWLFGFWRVFAAVPTAGSNTILRASSDTAGFPSDSNGPDTPAGSFSQNVSLSGSVNWHGGGVSFAPVVASANGNFLELL